MCQRHGLHLANAAYSWCKTIYIFGIFFIFRLCKTNKNCMYLSQWWSSSLFPYLNVFEALLIVCNLRQVIWYLLNSNVTEVIFLIYCLYANFASIFFRYCFDSLLSNYMVQTTSFSNGCFFLMRVRILKISHITNISNEQTTENKRTQQTDAF